jgi:hypothetical protein
MKMKKEFLWGIIVVVILSTYMTWSKSDRDIKRTIPEAGALFELKQLRDQGEHAKADELLNRRLGYMPKLLTRGNPFPPAAGVTLAKEIEAYLEQSTQQTNTEQNIRQVSSEGAPSDEPSM